MKKTASISLIFVFLITSCFVKKDRYCGKVTEKYLLHKNNGGVYNIIFYCDSLHKNINVSVTSSTYVNTNVGETVCFYMEEWKTNQ